MYIPTEIKSPEVMDLWPPVVAKELGTGAQTGPGDLQEWGLQTDSSCMEHYSSHQQLPT